MECQNCNSAIADHILDRFPLELSANIEEHLLVCEACRPTVDRFESAVENLSVFVTADPFPESHHADGQIRHIIVIEDNAADVMLIKQALRDHCAQAIVTVASDGDEAVQLLSVIKGHSEPDLIMLDLNLPKRDGYEVLEFLRANPQLRTTPVAIFTSSDRAVDADKAYSMGADCYVLKGHDLESYARNVEAICSFWSSAGAAVPSHLAR